MDMQNLNYILISL